MDNNYNPRELLDSDDHQLIQIDYKIRYFNGFRVCDRWTFHCQRLGTNLVDACELAVLNNLSGHTWADEDEAVSTQPITIKKFDIKSGKCVWSLDKQDWDSYVTSCEIYYGGGDYSLN